TDSPSRCRASASLAGWCRSRTPSWSAPRPPAPGRSRHRSPTPARPAAPACSTSGRCAGPPAAQARTRAGRRRRRRSARRVSWPCVLDLHPDRRRQEEVGADDQRFAADADLAHIHELARRDRAAGLRPEILHPGFVGAGKLAQHLLDRAEADGVLEVGEIAPRHGGKRGTPQRPTMLVKQKNEGLEKYERGLGILDLLKPRPLAGRQQQVGGKPYPLLDEQLLDPDGEAPASD